MQQSVEDRRGERLVAGEKLGPVADRLVRGDEDRAATVAIRHQPKEQACFVARHGFEAKFVDDEQDRVEALAVAGTHLRLVLPSSLPMRITHCVARAPTFRIEAGKFCAEQEDLRGVVEP